MDGINAIRKARHAPIMKTLGVFVSANVLCSILAGVGGLLQGRWVDPETMGEFRKYTISMQYLLIALVFVQDGIRRQFPYLIGKGLKDEAAAVAGVAKSFYISVSFVFSSVFVVLSLIGLFRQDYYAFIGWLAQVFFVWSSVYDSFLQVIYRRSMEFKRLSYNNLISSAIAFLLLAVVRAFGFWGLAIRTSLNYLSKTYLDARHLPLKIKAHFDFKRFKELAKISIPLSTIGYIRTSFLTASYSAIVFKYCGAEGLGLYGTAVAFQGFSMLFVSSIEQVFSVKIANKFGETESIFAAVKVVLIPTIFAILASIALACALCIVIGPFIRLVLPKYVAAIPIVYVLSIDLVFKSAKIPLGVLSTALMYKNIYIIGFVKVGVALGACLLVPKTMIWLAGALMLGEFSELVISYFFLMRACHVEKAFM